MAASSSYAYSLCKKVYESPPIKKMKKIPNQSGFSPSLISAAKCRRNVFGGVGIMCSSSAAVSDEEDNTNKVRRRVLKVGLICGGPSAERGISLNSARSVLDHIQVGTTFHFNQK